MQWNGKRGVAFNDANQGFRERIIVAALKDLEAMSLDLIYDLMHEEAEWANKTLTFRYYLPELTEHLLIKDFEGYIEKIVATYSQNLHAMKSMVDVKSSDALLNKWMVQLAYKNRLNTDSALNYDAMMSELQSLLDLREEERQKKEDFEHYVKHKDPLPVAFKKALKYFWHETEMHHLALFFIVPGALLIGYYLFGFSILYGMLPIFRALIIIYLMYRVANWIVM